MRTFLVWVMSWRRRRRERVFYEDPWEGFARPDGIAGVALPGWQPILFLDGEEDGIGRLVRETNDLLKRQMGS